MSQVIRHGNEIHVTGLQAPDITTVLAPDAARRIVADIRASITADAALCDEIETALGEAS